MENICNSAVQKDLMQSTGLCPSELSFDKREMKRSKGAAKPLPGCSGMPLRGGFEVDDHRMESNKHSLMTNIGFSH